MSRWRCKCAAPWQWNLDRVTCCIACGMSKPSPVPQTQEAPVTEVPAPEKAATCARCKERGKAIHGLEQRLKAKQEELMALRRLYMGVLEINLVLKAQQSGTPATEASSPAESEEGVQQPNVREELDQFINASEKRVAVWSEAQRAAFREATGATEPAPQPPNVPTEEESRKAFETQFSHLNLKRNSQGDFMSSEIRWLEIAWQAAVKWALGAREESK